MDLINDNMETIENVDSSNAIIIIFVFFTRKMCFVRFAKILILRWDLGRSSGLPWRPCFATFSLLAPKSLGGTR